MSLEQGFRSIKTETIIYSPLLIEVQREDNSSSCPDFKNKRCIVCGKIFKDNISTKDEIKHIDTHTDLEISKVLTSHNCISKIKSMNGEVSNG